MIVQVALVPLPYGYRSLEGRRCVRTRVWNSVGAAVGAPRRAEMRAPLLVDVVCRLRERVGLPAFNVDVVEHAHVPNGVFGLER